MLSAVHLDIVTQTIYNQIENLQKQIINRIKTGAAREQDALHDLVDQITAHFHALDTLHGNTIKASAAATQQIKEQVGVAQQQAAAVADTVDAVIQKAAQVS